MTKLIRQDYQPPVYLIDQTDLIFDVPESHEAATLVTATMHYKLNNGNEGAPLVLNAQDLDLLSITIDKQPIDLSTVAITADGDSQLVTIPNVPAEGILVIQNRLKPWTNESCEGLFGSKGSLLTQCEAQSFRKITPYIDRPDNLAVFTCEIRASKAQLPVLLSNGNVIASGALPDGRHYAKYQDPWPKPSYLFAIFAADIAHLHQVHTTKSGKKINVFVHVKAENKVKAEMAMECILAAMKWDEEHFELEYDLDNCHLVGSESFNMGAMENKGLIIFNELSLLADAETTTDTRRLYIWDTISHEYFHNYAGNRVTVNKWLELALKEGLATFKEAMFMKDTFGHAAYRIADEVQDMRVRQFAEDAGPTRHAVRPNEVDSIDNIYTSTIYTKGSELINMLAGMLGRKTCIEGIKHYFQKHDGQAVTIEDFVRAHEEVSGRNLKQFLLWYTTAGTPQIRISDEYDAFQGTYQFHVKQSTVNTAGDFMPLMHIPIALNLLDSNGVNMLAEDCMLEVTAAEQTFTFDNISERPTPSFLRDFSAPVKVIASPLSTEQKLFLYSNDSDAVNRFLMGKEIMNAEIRRLAVQIVNSQNTSAASVQLVINQQHVFPQPAHLLVDEELLKAMRAILLDPTLDLRFKTLLLELPDLTDVISTRRVIDLDSVVAARKLLERQFAEICEEELKDLYLNTETRGSNALTPELIGKRAAHGACLHYLMALDLPEYTITSLEQFAAATNMTDRTSALQALVTREYHGFASIGQLALDNFHHAWQHDNQALSVWFKSQALADVPNAVENMQALLQHPSFNIKIPNHVYATVRLFAGENVAHFHRADGAGYKFVIDAIIKIEPVNPSLASRVLLNLFDDCNKFDLNRQDKMIAELRRLEAVPNLSEATRDLVTKKLAKAPPLTPEVPATMLRQFEGKLRSHSADDVHVATALDASKVAVLPAERLATV